MQQHAAAFTRLGWVYNKNVTDVTAAYRDMLLRPLLLLVLVVAAVGATVPLMYTLGAKGGSISQGDMLAFAIGSSQSQSVCIAGAPYPPWSSVSKCVSSVEDPFLATQGLFYASIPVTEGIRVIVPPWFNASTTGATVSSDSIAIVWLSIFLGVTVVAFASYIIAYHNCKRTTTTTAYTQVQSSADGGH